MAIQLVTIERCFLLVVLVSAAWFSFPYLSSESLWPDEALYAWSARQIAHDPAAMFSREVIERQPPLFPAVLAVVSRFSHTEELFRGLALLGGLASVVLMFFLGEAWGGNGFVGLIAAMGIAYNALFQFSAARILSDNMQMLLFIALALALNRISEGSRGRDHGVVGVCAALLVLTKWSGALSLGIIAAYYVLYVKNWRHRLWLPLGIAMVTLLMMLCINRMQLGTWIPFSSAVQGGGKLGAPWWMEGMILNHTVYLPSFWLFFLTGLAGLWLGAYAKRVFIVLWFGATFALLSLSGEKDPRYVLVALPAALLVYAVALDYIIKTCWGGARQRWAQLVAVVFVGCICLTRVVKAEAEMAAYYSLYTGFREIAQEVRRLACPLEKWLVLSESTRTIRYFTGIPYTHSGGALDRLPKTFAELKGIVDGQDKAVLLLVDNWEAYQPQWSYPPSETKFRQIESLGFKLKQVVSKKWYAWPQKQYVVSPVIWLYAYSPDAGGGGPRP